MRKLPGVQKGKAGVRVLSDAEVAKAIGLQRQGLTLQAIASVVGASVPTVGRYLQQAGSVPLSRRGRPRGAALPGVGRLAPAAVVATEAASDELPSSADCSSVVIDAIERLFDLMETTVVFDADVELTGNNVHGEGVYLVGHLSASSDGATWSDLPRRWKGTHVPGGGGATE